jgi:hypothetical protein
MKRKDITVLNDDCRMTIDIACLVPQAPLSIRTRPKLWRHIGSPARYRIRTGADVAEVKLDEAATLITCVLRYKTVSGHTESGIRIRDLSQVLDGGALLEIEN